MEFLFKREVLCYRYKSQEEKNNHKKEMINAGYIENNSEKYIFGVNYYAEYFINKK